VRDTRQNKRKEFSVSCKLLQCLYPPSKAKMKFQIFTRNDVIKFVKATTNILATERVLILSCRKLHLLCIRKSHIQIFTCACLCIKELLGLKTATRLKPSIHLEHIQKETNHCYVALRCWKVGTLRRTKLLLKEPDLDWLNIFTVGQYVKKLECYI
jgi:hypothetical protein